MQAASNVSFWLDGIVLGGLSHVRAAMLCLHRYLATKGGGCVTFCELSIFTLVTGVISGVISAYIVRFIDRKRKNDRHSPKSGH